MAVRDPEQDRHDPKVEEPGDTNAADIVGRTGEEMPEQGHDGIDPDDRSRPAEGDREEDEDLDGHPV